MKISKKESYMLLMLLGVMIVFCAFWFGFRNISAKTETLSREADVIDAEVQKYSLIKDNIDVYQVGIQEATEKINNIVAKIPSDVLPEDAMMLAREFEKDNKNTFVSSVSLSDRENVASVTSNPVNETSTPITYYLNKNEVSYVHSNSYAGLKDLVEYISNHKNRMSIDTIMVAYDEETGMLAGTTVVDFYSIQGTGKDYIPQSINNIRLGTKNIFGTVEKPVPQATEE